MRQPARSRAPERGQGILHGLAKGQRFGQGGRGRQRHAQIHHFGARAVIERHTAGESEGRRRGSTRGQAGQGTGGPSTSMSSGTDEFCRPRLVDHRRWQDPRTLKPHRSSAPPQARPTTDPRTGTSRRGRKAWPNLTRTPTIFSCSPSRADTPGSPRRQGLPGLSAWAVSSPASACSQRTSAVRPGRKGPRSRSRPPPRCCDPPA